MKGWKEKGEKRKRHQLTIGSAVRHAANAQAAALLCAAAGTSHLRPPDSRSQPPKAAELLHEYS